MASRRFLSKGYLRALASQRPFFIVSRLGSRAGSVPRTLAPLWWLRDMALVFTAAEHSLQFPGIYLCEKIQEEYQPKLGIYVFSPHCAMKYNVDRTIVCNDLFNQSNKFE